MRQALEGAGKERYRAGRRVLTPLCRPVGYVVDRFRRGSRQLKISGALEHIHKIAACQSWGAATTYQGNLDEMVVTRERDASIANVTEVTIACWDRKIRDENNGSA